MENLELYNFIVYNLRQINLGSLVIFHCWQLPVLLPLAELLSQKYIFSQYVNLNQSQDNLANFDMDYLNTDLDRMGVFLDMNCEQSAFITNQSSRACLYTQYLHWLLYDKSGNMSHLIEQFESANLSINADVTYVKAETKKNLNNSRIFTLFDVYNKGSHRGGKLNITIDQSVYCNASSCEIHQYLSGLHKRTRIQQRSNLRGITLRQVGMISTLPMNSSEEAFMNLLNSEGSVHLDWASRVGYRNNFHLQELLEFNVSFTWRDKWSETDTTGGAIAEIINERADLSTTPFVLTPERLRFIYSTSEISEIRSLCIFRTPRSADMKAGVYLAPFKASVWLAFTALLVLSGILLWITFRLEKHWMSSCLKFIPSLLTSCLISFGTAFIQSSYLIPSSTGGRLAFIAIMLTSFLMYNYYTSIVVSTLLGAPVRSDIKTIQQLADSSLDVSFETVPFTVSYINNSQRPDVRNLFKRKVEGHSPQTVWLSGQAGVDKVRDQPGFVYVSEASNLYHIIEKSFLPHEICDLNEIPFRPETIMNLIIHKNSTYKELIRQIQVRMLECGMTQKHRVYYTKTKLHCFANNHVVSVGMEYAAPLFLALLCAYFVAFLTLILELIWARFSTSQSERSIG